MVRQGAVGGRGFTAVCALLNEQALAKSRLFTAQRGLYCEVGFCVNYWGAPLILSSKPFGTNPDPALTGIPRGSQVLWEVSTIQAFLAPFLDGGCVSDPPGDISLKKHPCWFQREAHPPTHLGGH